MSDTHKDAQQHMQEVADFHESCDDMRVRFYLAVQAKTEAEEATTEEEDQEKGWFSKLFKRLF